jgi:hypothetical protein
VKLEFSIEAARAEADRLGYLIAVDETPHMPAPLTHVAHAHPVVEEGEGSLGLFLCYGSSVADAVKAGLEIISGHVKLGQPWAEDLLRPRRRDSAEPEARPPSG